MQPIIHTRLKVLVAEVVIVTWSENVLAGESDCLQRELVMAAVVGRGTALVLSRASNPRRPCREVNDTACLTSTTRRAAVDGRLSLSL